MEVQIQHADELRKIATKANANYAEEKYKKLCEENIPKFLRAAHAGKYEFKIAIDSADPIVLKAWERFANALTLADYDVRFEWYDGHREISNATVSWVEKLKKI